jgi:lactobin A/cerein 7B family class IIb bacteriocin
MIMELQTVSEHELENIEGGCLALLAGIAVAAAIVCWASDAR